jgi:P-type Ca2+ transporter type 2C
MITFDKVGEDAIFTPTTVDDPLPTLGPSNTDMGYQHNLDDISPVIATSSNRCSTFGDSQQASPTSGAYTGYGGGANIAHGREPLGEPKNGDVHIERKLIALTPEQLAELHDPKNINILRGMGGLPGLISGLRSDANHGLRHENKLRRRTTLLKFMEHDSREEAIPWEDNDKEDAHKGIKSMSGQKTDRERSGETRPKEHVPISERKRTMTNSDPSYEDRRRIFGVNRIPSRKSKSLLQLMWIVLHDQILVKFSLFLVLI